MAFVRVSIFVSSLNQVGDSDPLSVVFRKCDITHEPQEEPLENIACFAVAPCVCGSSVRSDRRQDPATAVHRRTPLLGIQQLLSDVSWGYFSEPPVSSISDTSARMPQGWQPLPRFGCRYDRRR